jgi:hypothetical protein
MRIAQVAPLSESVPPTGYGGTERVVSFLRGRGLVVGAKGPSTSRDRAGAQINDVPEVSSAGRSHELQRRDAGGPRCGARRLSPPSIP